MSSLFRWEPPCWDPAWQDELDRLAPRTERGAAWLKLVWLAGEPWKPMFHVQRFAVAQMFPPGQIPPIVLADLEGEHPRKGAYFDGEQLVTARVSTVNREQWEWYQETGCYGRIYWIVQGAPGGHRRRWGELESGLAEALGGDAQPPAPGDLSYQPFSMRVVERLRELDRIQRYGSAVPTSLAAVDAARREEERALRAQLFDTVTDQVQETLTFTHQERQKIRDAWRRQAATAEPKPWETADLDEVREDFVEAR